MRLIRRIYTWLKYDSLRVESNFEKAVEDWHCSPPEKDNCAKYRSLHESLGLTWKQYCDLVDKR